MSLPNDRSGGSQNSHPFLQLLAPSLILVQILYGGSVKPGNASALFSQPDIDGGLIGGATLDADDFLGICKAG